MLFKTLILASTASASCLHGLNLFKRADEVRISTFGYGPLNGPFNWASLAPENEACKNGTNQSPINIDSKIPLAKSKPKLTVPRVSESIFENLGSTIEVLANGTTSFEGTDYRLVQFHMHTPSEHHIDGEYYPLEIHMVHQGIADNTKLAVIGLMFQVSAGKSSSIISSLSGSLDKITVPGTKTAIKGGIDYKDVISAIETSEIVQYTGSLTTPPCAEGVTFLLLKNPLDVSVKDFNAIKKIVKFNSRFIQNELGNTNILEVGGLSGTPGAIMPAGVNATVPQAPAVVADAVPAASPAPAQQNGQAGDKNGCSVHVDLPLSLNLPKIIGGCTMIYKDDSAAAKRDAQNEPIHNPPVTPIGDRAVPVQKRTPKYAN